jgi:hypothetical protein
MPTFRITDNTTGQVYEMNLDQEPTQDQLAFLIDQPEQVNNVGKAKPNDNFVETFDPAEKRKKAIENNIKVLEKSLPSNTSLPSNKLQ